MKPMTRLELWVEFYKAALTGYSSKLFNMEMQNLAGVDDMAAESADLAMARYDALEAKVMTEGRDKYAEANNPDGKVRLRDLWGSGTMVWR